MLALVAILVYISNADGNLAKISKPSQAIKITNITLFPSSSSSSSFFQTSSTSSTFSVLSPVMSRYYDEHGDDYFRGNDSRSDAQNVTMQATSQQSGGNRGEYGEFPRYDEAWSRNARLDTNPRLLARMPWVLPQSVRNEQFVRRYLSGRVFPCGTSVEAMYSYDWLNRIAVPDAELHVRRNETVQMARERLVGQISVRHRRHHQPLQAIPSDFGVDAYAYRTLGEIGYVNAVVGMDVSRWYGTPTVNSDALCWSAPIIRAEFRYVRKPKLFWEWNKWERRIRARTGLLVSYQCIEAENLLTQARHRHFTPVPFGFGMREMSPGCRAELPPVVTYKGSALAYDPNSEYWTAFNTEWAGRVSAWVLWDLYESYRLWYVPCQVRADIRAVKLDFVLGGQMNEDELHWLILVIDSVHWRTAEFVYTRQGDRSYEDPGQLATGDFIWYDPWRQERIDKSRAMLRRQQRREIPVGHPRGYVFRDRELRNEELETSDEDEDHPGVMPSSNNTTAAPVTSGGARRRSVGMSTAGPVIRTLRQTDELDLSVPDNLREVRVFLRDCGVDMNEVPRSSCGLKDWFTGRLNRPRTVLCDNCAAEQGEMCYTGYQNGDPARVQAVMDVEPTSGVNANQEAAAQGGEADRPTAGF